MTELPPDPSTYEGDEGAPRADVPPPVRYQPPDPAPVPTTPAPVAHERTGQPSVGDRLAAVSGPLSLILFFFCGFVLHGWAWSWIFFLLPGVFYAWNRGDRRDR